MDPCNYHQGLVDEIVRGNQEHADSMRELRAGIAEIRDALIGTLEKQGLIGRVSADTVMIKGQLNIIEAWKEEKESELKSLGKKLIGFVGGVIFTAAIGVIAIAKWMIN